MDTFEILSQRLWIGPAPSQNELLELKKRLQGELVILDLTHDQKEREFCTRIGLVYEDRAPEIQETYSPVPVGKLKTFARIIDEHVSAGRKVYVHCSAGKGRSPTVAAAYLIHTGTPLAEARSHVRSIAGAWEGRDAVYSSSLEDLQAMCEMTRDNPAEPF